MASMPSPEEMAALQRLSDNYVPEIQGPLVGSKQPISTLSAEYANADPVYRQKTATLTNKYTHYRVMRGDGNCGWRALALLYLEAFYRMGDRRRIELEIERLTSLNTLLMQAGFAEIIYSDFVESTIEMLQKTLDAILNGLGDEFLTESFNDESVSSAIIMHFRLLASAHMKSNPEGYAPFLQVPIDQYCSTHLEPFKVEIEHIGIQALMDVVIGPAGFRMEITYLDRTPGTEANTIQIEPTNPIYPTPPTLRLLFKPDHYDILYVAEQIPPRQDAMQVNRATMSENYGQYGYQPLYESIAMTQYIPGMSYAFPQATPSMNFTSSMDHGYGYTPAPIPAIPTSMAPLTSATRERTPTSTLPMTSPSPTTTSSTSRTPPATSPTKVYSPTSSFPLLDKSKDPIRMVAENHLPMSNIPIQTRPFKESEFNQIHFMNENFTPEFYKPNSPSRSKKH